MAAILTAEGVTVSFGGLQAVKKMEISASPGQVVGIIGPNGAGKSTFFNAISGHQPVNEGKVIFRDRDVTEIAPHIRARMGLARTFQLGGLIEDLTAQENVVLGLDHALRAGLLAGDTDSAGAAVGFLARFELDAVAQELVFNLAAGVRRQIEIARTIASGARLILLDEPGAGLSEGEREQLVTMIRGLAQEGKAFLITDHSTDFVFSVSDHISVMNFGELIASGTPAAIRKHPEVLEAYLGHQ